MYVEACPCVNAALWDALTLGAAQWADYVRCSLLSVFKSISLVMQQRLDGGMSCGFSILRALTWVYLCHRINVNISVIYALCGFTDKVTKWKVVVLDLLCEKQTLHKCGTKEENAAEENKSRLVYVCDSVLKDSREFDQRIQVSGGWKKQGGGRWFSAPGGSLHSLHFFARDTDFAFKGHPMLSFLSAVLHFAPTKRIHLEGGGAFAAIGIFFFFFWPFKKI